MDTFKNHKSDENSWNWSKNIQYTADEVLVPETVHDVQKIVKSKQYKNIKVFGTRHCFNKIADTREYAPGYKTGTTAHVSLEKFTWTQFDKAVFKGMESSGEQPVVRFGAGLTYSKLIEAVDAKGLAIENLPSLPHINVVGSMITATHGSGHKYQIFANNILDFDIVFADGTLKTLSRENTPHFGNYLLNFGGLGVITSMTMRLVPTFMVSKSIYQNLQWDVLFQPDNFEAIMHRQDFLSFFCVWKSREMSSVWVGKKYFKGDPVPAKEMEYYGAKHITTPNIHPVPGRDSSPCVTHGEGPWRQKIYHFLPDKPPSSAGDELQTEYFVPFDAFIPAMNDLFEQRNHFNHLVQVTEIRMALGDNLPMSPLKGRTCIGVHFTWYRKHKEVLAVLPLIENILQKYTVKPHFGKIFQMSGQRFEELFGEDLDVLRGLIVKHDQQGKFRNNFMDRYLFSNAAGPLDEKKLIEIQKKKCPYHAKL